MTTGQILEPLSVSFSTGMMTRPAPSTKSTANIADVANQRVLIVDDDRAIRVVLKRALSPLNVDADQASSGTEALQMIARDKYDLVLLDISMPGMGGFETLEVIRSSASQDDLPVIMVTAASDRETEIKALRCGANDHLTKPLDDAIAAARVQTHLKMVSARDELKRCNERFELATKGSDAGIWDWDLVSGEVYYSPRWKAILGLSADSNVRQGEDMFGRFHPEDVAAAREELRRHLDGEIPHFETEVRVRHETKSYRWMLCRGLAVRGPGGVPNRISGALIDITRNKVADALTGLPNQLQFNDNVDRCFDRFKREPSDLFCVMYLDVDNFKMVNDSYGHQAGDRYLIDVGARIQQSLRTCDSAMARLGGDEFAVLVQDIRDSEATARIATRILNSLKEPITLDCGSKIRAGVSIGISIASDRCKIKDDLLREADTAMFEAKSRGKNCYSVYDPRMHAQVRERLTIENDLHTAIERDELVLHYQPIVELPHGNVVGVEALARWNHPTRGLVSPLEFIPVAEDTGIIVPIGQWVIREACRTLAVWQARSKGFETLKLNLNVSAIQFRDPELVSTVREAVQENGLQPGQLGLEITESLLMDRPDAAALLLGELRSFGVRIAIDDFGTGFSSLSSLRHYPLDDIKIDRSFVNRIDVDSNLAIVRAIRGLADGLSLKIVAEGIETRSQLQKLCSAGCQFGQGFYFCRPIPGDELANRLSATKFNLLPLE
ncbi:MAG: EAL domain-containing protein [Pirellulaceae bacterium]|nr:EAL domain-containing protein [Pirellulaceae bacterium]